MSSFQSRSTFPNNRAILAHSPADMLPIGAASKFHLTLFIFWMYNSRGNGTYRVHATVGGREPAVRWGVESGAFTGWPAY